MKSLTHVVCLLALSHALVIDWVEGFNDARVQLRGLQVKPAGVVVCADNERVAVSSYFTNQGMFLLRATRTYHERYISSTVPQLVIDTPHELYNLGLLFVDYHNVAQPTQVSIHTINGFTNMGTIKLHYWGQPAIQPTTRSHFQTAPDLDITSSGAIFNGGTLDVAGNPGYPVGMNVQITALRHPLTNDGTICLLNANYYQRSHIAGTGCILVSLDSVLSLNLDLYMAGATHTVYLYPDKGTATLVLRVNDFSRKHRVRVVGFRKQTIIRFEKRMRRITYKHGQLKVSLGGKSTSIKIYVGYNYDASQFLFDHTSITYSGDVDVITPAVCRCPFLNGEEKNAVHRMKKKLKEVLVKYFRKSFNA